MTVAKLIRKKLRQIKRWIRTYPSRFAYILLLSVAILGYASYMENQKLSVNPASYKPLLNLIAKAESNGNYNAYFGNASNTEIDFTAMSIAEVMNWQTSYVQQGSPSSAVGKYQIISPTLAGLVDELAIDTTQPFDEPTQDKLAMTLLERRGSISYVNRELDREQFAANLAKEWAALPKVLGDHPDQSYYAGDGLNKSSVKVDEVLKAIDPISAK